MPSSSPAPTSSPAKISIDPVCGREVDSADSLSAGHAGYHYSFCSAACRGKFRADPERYANGKHSQNPWSAAPFFKPHPRTATRAATGSPTMHGRTAKQPTRSWNEYLPLIILFGLSVAVALAKQGAYAGPFDSRSAMHDFMGVFLVIFSMFKLFDLAGFADGFQMYDLLAKPFRPYAYAYPFIELGLGLGYLAAWNLPVIYGVTIAVMTFGAVGVIRALRRGLDINCACMGTVLKVPLSTVALTEDLGMAVMAALMWVAL